GLPLGAVEGLSATKAETITARLLRCVGATAAWQNVRERLASGFGIRSHEIRELHAQLDRVSKSEDTFRTPKLRRIAGKIKPRKPSRSFRRIERKWASVVTRLRGLPD